ncbi:MAG TPA: hypothetical protein PLG94_04080 [Smithellaceae bacterium]|nr:hypothetical protein [Smithellaceae bacterium]HPL65679.1 hypothetical protein [Smithellaceae bacterium]
MKRILKKLLKSLIDKMLFLIPHPQQIAAKCSPAIKVSQRQLYNFYQYAIANGHLFDISDTGFRNYSQFEEDGILLYIFAAIKAPHRTFIDIGAGDGINSNCANLAVNFGWDGLFIDGNPVNVKRGKKYYATHPDTWAYPPKFVQAFVQRENINQLIESAGFAGRVDLLSIDIDGNDYWIWDALSVVEPRVVIIETHIEFGMQNIVVPYDKDYCYPGRHPDYYGASPTAMEKLGKKKGYRLVGAMNYGFNTIYVKNGIGEDILPEVTVEHVMRHPRNVERQKLFEAIKDWEYLHV